MRSFEVRAVTNGKDALSELQQSLPDLILADIAMLVMNDLELVKQIKSKSSMAKVPIVVMTAFKKGYLTWAWAAGANELLAKHFCGKRFISDDFPRLTCFS